MPETNKGRLPGSGVGTAEGASTSFTVLVVALVELAKPTANPVAAGVNSLEKVTSRASPLPSAVLLVSKAAG